MNQTSETMPVNRKSLPDCVEFIQTIAVDIHGLGRGKMYPIEKLQDILQDKQEQVCLAQILGPRLELPTCIEEIADSNVRNKFIVPDPSTLRVAPWSKDSSLAMVFIDIQDKDPGRLWPFNPRLLAVNKIKELESMGLRILIGVENEFRLFDKCTKQPFTDRIEFFNQFAHATLLYPFVRKLRTALKPVDVEFDSCNFEYGRGQVEIPLKAYFGIDGIDKVWLFKETARHVAHEMGLIASFMSVPLANETANGLHVNHSLYKVTHDGQTNVLWNPSQKNQLSDIGKHWLAGIMKHTKALCAFFCPTVNCYRRVRAAVWAPNNVSYNYDDRLVALRIKTSRERGDSNFIENRLPTSSCNMYLAVAGMIAAGMDGIRNKLELIEPGNGSHCEMLPRSLPEALDCLRSDKYLVHELGEKFIDWFIKVKIETEVVPLKDVDLDDFTEEGFAKEVETYFKF